MSSYLRGRSGSLRGSRSTTAGTANGLCDNPTRGRCGVVLRISSVDHMTSSHRLPRNTQRRRRWSAALLLVGVAAFTALPMTPAGHATAQSSTIRSTSNSEVSDGRTGDPAAAAVVRQLLDRNGAGAIAALPSDFASRMGYRPVLEGDDASNPGGDCSSPVPMPARFEPLCRTHDFGYDMLRYAARVGNPLGPWARLGLDTALVTRMRETCHDPLCMGAAELARVGVGLNTWHEGDGPPQDRGNVLAATSSAVGHLVHDDPDGNSDVERDGTQASSEATR